ncbi:unnamed protein product, partial [marine sediment metagenome]
LEFALINIIKIVDQDSHLHSHIPIELSLKEITELESKHRLKNPTDRMWPHTNLNTVRLQYKRKLKEK